MSGKTSPVAPRGKAPGPTPPRPTPAGTPGATQPHPHPKNGAPTEDAIRARAYSLWEQAGYPWGDGVEFWLRAEQELLSAN